jgi:hypothetical protein
VDPGDGVPYEHDGNTATVYYFALFYNRAAADLLAGKGGKRQSLDDFAVVVNVPTAITSKPSKDRNPRGIVEQLKAEGFANRDDARRRLAVVIGYNILLTSETDREAKKAEALAGMKALCGFEDFPVAVMAYFTKWNKKKKDETYPYGVIRGAIKDGPRNAKGIRSECQLLGTIPFVFACTPEFVRLFKKEFGEDVYILVMDPDANTLLRPTEVTHLFDRYARAISASKERYGTRPLVVTSNYTYELPSSGNTETTGPRPAPNSAAVHSVLLRNAVSIGLAEASPIIPYFAEPNLLIRATPQALNATFGVGKGEGWVYLLATLELMDGKKRNLQRRLEMSQAHVLWDRCSRIPTDARPAMDFAEPKDASEYLQAVAHDGKQALNFRNAAKNMVQRLFSKGSLDKTGLVFSLFTFYWASEWCQFHPIVLRILTHCPIVTIAWLDGNLALALDVARRARAHEGSVKAFCESLTIKLSKGEEKAIAMDVDEGLGKVLDATLSELKGCDGDFVVWTKTFIALRGLRAGPFAATHAFSALLDDLSEYQTNLPLLGILSTIHEVSASIENWPQHVNTLLDSSPFFTNRFPEPSPSSKAPKSTLVSTSPFLGGKGPSPSAPDTESKDKEKASDENPSGLPDLTFADLAREGKKWLDAIPERPAPRTDVSTSESLDQDEFSDLDEYVESPIAAKEKKGSKDEREEDDEPLIEAAADYELTPLLATLGVLHVSTTERYDENDQRLMLTGARYSGLQLLLSFGQCLAYQGMWQGHAATALRQLLPGWTSEMDLEPSTASAMQTEGEEEKKGSKVETDAEPPSRPPPRRSPTGIDVGLGVLELRNDELERFLQEDASPKEEKKKEPQTRRQRDTRRGNTPKKTDRKKEAQRRNPNANAAPSCAYCGSGSGTFRFECVLKQSRRCSGRTLLCDACANGPAKQNVDACVCWSCAG